MISLILVGAVLITTVAVMALAGPVADAAAPEPLANSGLHGWLTAPGGPYLVDGSGRTVFLHGVNAVYKSAPYELSIDPGEPWTFSGSDAARIASLGFDVVRLGIIWQGLEPGNLGANNPAICTPGRPRDPHQFDPARVASYLDQVENVVDLLGRHHIYTLLDMHQDIYSSVFGGEGAPAWAVCTGGSSFVPPKGRWSNAYSQATLDDAVAHFWANDVEGDLQGELIRVWQAVAQRFSDNQWVVGYDLLNEPFSTSLLASDPAIADQVECFYTGRAHPGLSSPGGAPLSCPQDDPAVGLIPAIERIDPHHLVFFEPDIYGLRHQPNGIGPMDYPNLVFGFHAYCASRSPVTGNPTDVAACAHQVGATISRRTSERADQVTASQPGGPPPFMSEFGATINPDLLDKTTAVADAYQLGWTYWDWKYYNDPTGSSDEALVAPDGKLEPTADALARAYPQAVAGTPTSFSFDPTTERFSLSYTANPEATAPTVIFVPVRQHYPSGYCANAVGGRVLSSVDSDHLVVANTTDSGTVSVTVSPGHCEKSATLAISSTSITHPPDIVSHRELRSQSRVAQHPPTTTGAESPRSRSRSSNEHTP